MDNCIKNIGRSDSYYIFSKQMEKHGKKSPNFPSASHLYEYTADA